MHTFKGTDYMNFEEALEKCNPMISACIRKLGIYKNHENFRQAGMIGLWIALTRYDSEMGKFEPFAYRSIYGTILDELKKENLLEDPIEDEALFSHIVKSQTHQCKNEALCLALEQLSGNERKLIEWLYKDRISLKEAAKLTEISIAGVKKRRERILHKLRESLK